jgi:hypothetical protein
MSFRKSILLLLINTFWVFNAQELKLSKVTIDELQEKHHLKDTSAVAAVLFQKGEVRFEGSYDQGFTRVLLVRKQIKIYKKEGYNWANQEVTYYLEDEKVTFLKAVTYNLVDGVIEKTSLKDEGTFTSKINKYWGQEKITMPNVKEGSIIEFEYEIRSDNIGSSREWKFQTSIPVNYSEYKVGIPSVFTFNKIIRGFIQPKFSSESGYNNEKIEFYTIVDVPAMKEELFVNNIDNYRSSISYELASMNIPSRAFKLFSTSWDAVVKSIYDNIYFGAELNKSGYFDDDINKIIAGLKSSDEKTVAIYNYVKMNMKWNDYDGYWCIDGVKKAYKDKVGNVAEINLMLTAMLRYAGVNANPILVSTRDNRIALFPSRTSFNYVIAGVETDSGMILLDATEKYATPNVLPLRDLNWYGRLIRKNGTSEDVDLMPKTHSDKLIFMTVVVSENGSINGKIRRHFGGQEALKFRNKNVDITNDSYLETLENENNSIVISDYVRDNDYDLSKPIVEIFSFKDTKDFEKIGDKIYITPLLFLTANENPFKQEKREYPVDFGYPIEEKYNINIEIPTGYIVETLPTSKNLVTGYDIGSFKYLVVNRGNKIQVSITIMLNVAIVPADYYDVLKNFFQQMITKQNEKIVLKKI